MADFRKWITVLFALALFAGLASAQAPLQCTASSAVTPQIRAESYTDLQGDIVITCTGGPQLAQGQTIPQTNIVIQTTVPVTSRLSSATGFTGLSEALLLIDEPGSGLTPAVPGAGPAASQTLCATPTTGCTTTVSVNASGTGAGIPYMASGSANMFQGYVSGNTVTFFGVPFLPPASTGAVRTLRITNIRVNATQFLGVTGVSQTISYISTNGATSLPIPYPAAVVTGFVQNSLSTTAKLDGTNGTLLQCNAPAGSAPGVTVSTVAFKELFATAFKTRVVPQTTAVASGTLTNYSPNSQNIPGGVYTGFGLSASESGFITSGNGNLTVGLADFGTRFKAVFTNIPAGVTLYVGTINNTATLPINSTTYPGNSTTTPLAVLVASPTAPEPVTIPTTTYATLTPVGGTATAVWEVINDNPNALDTFTFNVYVNYAPNTSNGLPTAPSTGNVTLGYAPTPSDIGITAAAAAAASSSAPIPRFVEASYTAPFVNIAICQTALMWPYVVVGGGFETGLAIANTTTDPFTTTQGHVAAQAGSCNLYWYGQQYTPAGSTAATTTAITYGCDQASAVAGACVGIGSAKVVPTGQVYTALGSSLQSVTAGNTWIGYIIGLCNFQYAHGYAAISDVGARNWVTSYLALVMQQSQFSVLRGVQAEAENQ